MKRFEQLQDVVALVHKIHMILIKLILFLLLISFFFFEAANSKRNYNYISLETFCKVKSHKLIMLTNNIIL